MIANKPIGEVTVEDIDERFASDSWLTAGGNVQSLLFAIRALELLPLAFTDKVSERHHVLLDYGCAMGDGTAVLAARFPVASVAGCDISAEAVARARARWPTVPFQVDDVRQPRFHANTIWCSHTLEHLPEPAAAVRALRERCNNLVVLVPPIEATPVIGPHVGAAATEEWLVQLPAPTFRAQFDIWRREDPQVADVGLLETSLLLVWEG